MTIEERRAREEHDRENPWRPMSTAKPDGTVCELLFNDMKGDYRVDSHYFLDTDGKWYRINPPEKVSIATIMNRRPAWTKLSPGRRANIKRTANDI